MSLFTKKPTIENLESFRDITDDVIEKDFVPYACHWDPHTIISKNGELMQVIKITGFAHERLGETDDDADLRTKIREAVLTCIPSTHYALWIHTIRRHKNLQSGGTFKRDFGGYLERFWNERNDWENQFMNEVYITVVREGETAEIFNPKVLARGLIPAFDQRVRDRYIEESLRELTEVTDKMLGTLLRFGAKRLTLSRREDTYYSEPCSFLGKLITFLDLDFAVTDEDLSQVLTDYDVTFGFNAMEVRMRKDGRRRFGAILTIKEYRELPIEALERLLQIPARFIISQCFDFVGAREALAGYQYQKELFDVSRAGLLAEKTGLIDILASNRNKSTDFGLHQMNMFLLADSVRALEDAVTKAAGVLTSLGMLPMREDIKFEECYWAQLPGNFEFIRRMRPLNTARIGGLAHLSNYPGGQRDGNHWGPAVSTFHTAARTPYFFNFHDGDNGHTTLIGPFGAGKTVLMNFLLAQARKFDPKLFFFDKGRGSEVFLRALGGAYYNPHPAADVADYARLKLNPFQLEDTQANRHFLRDWLMLLAGMQSDPAFLKGCEDAITAVMQLPAEGRSLASIVKALEMGNAEHAKLFAEWVGEGKHAAWFGTEDGLKSMPRVIGFNMDETIEDKAAFLPVLYYLIHRIGLSLDGKPAIVVMDEAWTLLDTPLFGDDRLRAWLTAMRARNAIAVLATERVEEAQGSAINAELMRHIATQIYLPDESADASYANAFGLTEREVAYLTVMNTDDRHFLHKRGGDTIVLELDLSGMDDIISVLSADAIHLEAMEQAIASENLTPGRWMPKFLELI